MFNDGNQHLFYEKLRVVVYKPSVCTAPNYLDLLSDLYIVLVNQELVSVFIFAFPIIRSCIT